MEYATSSIINRVSIAIAMVYGRDGQRWLL